MVPGVYNSRQGEDSELHVVAHVKSGADPEVEDDDPTTRGSMLVVGEMSWDQRSPGGVTGTWGFIVATWLFSDRDKRIFSIYSCFIKWYVTKTSIGEYRGGWQLQKM